MLVRNPAQRCLRPNHASGHAGGLRHLRNVNFGEQEEIANVLLLACCYQEVFTGGAGHSDSRLYCVAESEINSIVTVGAPLAMLAFPRSELAGGTFTSRVKSRLEKE